MHYYCSVLCIALLTGRIATLGSAEPAGCHWETTDKGDRCYLHVGRADMPASVDFFEAIALCAQRHNGTLPVLDSADVATKLGAYVDGLKSQSTRLFAIGVDGRPAPGRPVDEKASWHYSDGTRVRYTLWAAGEPSDQPNAKGLVCMWWSHGGAGFRQLSTTPCEAKLILDLVCEWRHAATTTTTVAPTTTTTTSSTTTSTTAVPTTTTTAAKTTTTPIVRTTTVATTRGSSTLPTRVPPVPPPSPRPQPTPAPVDTWTTAWDESDNSTSSAPGGHNGYTLLPPLLLAAVAAAGAFCLF